MICAAILAGGIGSRLKQGKPKQFVNINNKPILVHSVEIFLSVDELDKIIVSGAFGGLSWSNSICEMFFGKSTRTGPLRPVFAIWNASFTMRGISFTCCTW